MGPPIIGKGALCSDVKSKYEAARSLAQRADFRSVRESQAGILVHAWGS